MLTSSDKLQLKIAKIVLLAGMERNLVPTNREHGTTFLRFANCVRLDFTLMFQAFMSSPPARYAA
jgi:hypothetical protein